MTHEEIKKHLLENFTKDELIDAFVGGIVNTNREYVVHGEGIAEDVVKINLEVSMGQNTKDVAWVQFPGQKERYSIFGLINDLWYSPSFDKYVELLIKRGKE